MNSFFKIKERGSTVGREIVGGVTTFLAMAYILAVNPGILSASGMSWGSVFTATAISAAIATLVMGLFANLPVALAAGLGLNAFFSFTVVLGLGCSWQLALTAVLLEGILFILLSIIGIREAIIKSIPMGMKKAVSVGIGLFICIIGFENAGIVINNEATLISFATFSFAHKTALLAVIGLLITIVLYMLKVPGAILIGVIATTIIGIPMGVTVVSEDFKVFRLPDAPYGSRAVLRLEGKTREYEMAPMGRPAFYSARLSRRTGRMDCGGSRTPALGNRRPASCKRGGFKPQRRCRPDNILHFHCRIHTLPCDRIENSPQGNQKGT